MTCHSKKRRGETAEGGVWSRVQEVEGCGQQTPVKEIKEKGVGGEERKNI